MSIFYAFDVSEFTVYKVYFPEREGPTSEYEIGLMFCTFRSLLFCPGGFRGPLLPLPLLAGPPLGEATTPASGVFDATVASSRSKSTSSPHVLFFKK